MVDLLSYLVSYLLYFSFLYFIMINQKVEGLNNIGDKIKVALEHHQLGRFDAALADYLQIIPILTSSTDGIILSKIHSNAGAVYMQKGDYNEAKNQFSMAVEVSPQDVSSLLNLAVVLTTKLNEHKKALKYAMKVIQISPDNAKGYHLLGNILQNMGRMEDAEKYFIMAEQIAQEKLVAPASGRSNLAVEQNPILTHLQGLHVNDVVTSEMEGMSYNMTCLSTSPLVFKVQGIATIEECDDIITRSRDKLADSFVMGGSKIGTNEITIEMSGSTERSPTSNRHRHSENAWLPTDSILLAVQERMSALTSIPLSYIRRNAEELQVVRYPSQGYFNLHHDSSAFHPRLLTALIYLNDLDAGAGGETWFPFAGSALNTAEINVIDEALSVGGALDPYSGEGTNGIIVRPKKGDAIIFFNHKVFGSEEIDPYAIHAGLRITEGYEKWVANYWIGFDKVH